jgi:hypothetical protein
MVNFDLILVPQGQEYQAVLRGLTKVNYPLDGLIPIPIFASDLTHIMLKLEFKKPQQIKNILLLGLAGSLTEKNQIRDIVIYEECLEQESGKKRKTQPELSQKLQEKLDKKATMVKALTSDRLIWSVKEKQKLAQETQTQVVDMEGYQVLATLDPNLYSVAILRIISDDCSGDLPDLNPAIASDGSLKPLSLTLCFLQHPLAALRLIRNSLSSLKMLQKVTEVIFTRNPHSNQ